MSVWDEVVGQEDAISLLQMAADSAREIVDGAQGTATRSMSHAWLFTGPPGSGRSVAARGFAAALVCDGPVPGCGVCPNCHTARNGSNADILVFSTEKVTISIDEVRSLVTQAYRSPVGGKWRVIIVEDADRMLERTANVLLKSIEEPPERTVWILCAPAPDDVITTIRSRCRGLTLRIPTAQSVAQLLMERDGVDPTVALDAARAAQSHIGLARHLASDEKARVRRRDIVSAPIRANSVGTAVLAAQQLVNIAQEESEEATHNRNAAEKAELFRSLGLEEGARVAPHARAQVRALEEEQKRRATRAKRDVLDRAMIDLLSLYRDVLVSQCGGGAQIINSDMANMVTWLAQNSTVERTIFRMDSVLEARKRLAGNVPPLLAVEAMIVALLPEAPMGEVV